MNEVDKPWSPISIDELSTLFADAPFFWSLAGGHAIELAVGEPIRSHGDIDVLVLRKDHLALQAHLSSWDCWVADPPGTLRPWHASERLQVGVHDIWCRRGEAWELQVMLDESSGDLWRSRRSAQITVPLTEITRVSSNGIPYLAPHVQLYYKAKNPRKIDEIDLRAVIDHGVEFDRPWLCHAIQTVYGEGHPWLELINC